MGHVNAWLVFTCKALDKASLFFMHLLTYAESNVYVYNYSITLHGIYKHYMKHTKFTHPVSYLLWGVAEANYI